MKNTILFILTLTLGLATVDLAAEGIWTTKADMSTARYVLSSSVLDGIIYAIGGDAGSRASVVEAYDPVTDTWTQKSNMPMGRGAGASSVVNGRIYYMGGRLGANGANISSVIEYDPMTDTWTTKANTIPTPRTWLSSSVVNGKIYAIGGAVIVYGAPLSTVEEYDPVTDTWTRKADMPTARTCLSTSAVNGKIYAIGGSPGNPWYQGLTIVEEYDPATDTWIRKADMPTGRTYFSTCVVNGKIYAIGGVKSGGADHVSQVEEYDPVTDTWTTITDMPTARSGLATSVVNDKIYAIGGWIGSSTILTTVEEYGPYPIIIDFNGNGICDINDLVIMIENWETSESLCDIGPTPWGDGIVDRADLEVFMEYWNQVVDVAAYYKLDETEGQIAYDSSGHYHDANVIGDPNWQPEGGIVDGALEFDGINDYVSTPFILNPNTSPLSVFAWIKGGLAGQTIISQVDGMNWLSANISNGALMTELKGGGRTGSILISQTVITDNDWHRIGLTWDGANRILYVDDIVAAIDTQANLEGSEGGLYIGTGNALDADTFFYGLIDDVRIYNRAITP